MTDHISAHPANHSPYANYHQQKNEGINKSKQSAKPHTEENPQSAVAPTNNADAIEISLEAQRAARNSMLSNMTIQEVTPSMIKDINSHLNLTREQALAALAEQRANYVPPDPFDDEWSIENRTWGVPPAHIHGNNVVYTREDSYHIELTKMLEGKARNASMVAYELTRSLQGSVFAKDSTVAERAITREAAFRSAQYIADNYFHNPNEAKAFMDLITKIKEEDILKEKGYVFPRHALYVNGVLEPNTMEPFRNYSAPGMGNDYISPVGTARYLGAPEEMLQRGQFLTHGTTDIINYITSTVAKQSFPSQSSALSWDASLRTGILDAWNKNEREVTEIISRTLATFNNEIADHYLQRILKAF